MNMYLAILIPQDADGWSAHIPDFPSCSAASSNADLAKMRVAQEVAIVVGEMRRSGNRPPLPRPLEDVRADREWAEDRKLDWSRAVVTMVEVRA
jgi:predicted RNase H-like HicB family nuclease